MLKTQELRKKKAFIFDLDGTLTKSKSKMDKKMATVVLRLLETKLVAVVSGGALSQFQKQFLSRLSRRARRENLFLFPTNGARYMRFSSGRLKEVYRRELSKHEKKIIKETLKKALKECGYVFPKNSKGEVIEDRGTQITFSALGQKASLGEKTRWNRENDIRRNVVRKLVKYLPDFSTAAGGLTSIDIKKKGIDKAYAIREFLKAVKKRPNDAVFFGDALFPGGNDYPAKKTGVSIIQVANDAETIEILEKILT